MKIKEIEAFDAFMKHGTTKAAAETLGISQSMVSRLLIGLEDELGFALFKRTRNQLEILKKTRMLFLITNWAVSW